MAKRRQDIDAVHGALRTLRDRLPRLLDLLGAESEVDRRTWTTALDGRILPRLSPDFPLMVAITGGGSTGKSTLFNSILGEPLSTVGGRAGLNRRVLVAVPPDNLGRPEFIAELFRPFSGQLELLEARDQLTTPGPPLYVPAKALPSSVILMDTPDFDVGHGGRYLNRDVAAPVLTSADLLVYIFTNATYNAKANTDFIRDQLTRIGQRHCVLVYRVYESFSEGEVREHAVTVAENLYGEDWERFVLAIYRADDTNQVAAGKAPVRLHRVGPGQGLLPLLSELDPRVFRHRQNEQMLRDVVRQAVQLARDAAIESNAFTVYRDTLRLAQSHAVKEALSSLPLARISERIRRVFEETDPGFVRFSRRAGRVTAAPLRGVLWLMGRRSQAANEEAKARQLDPLAVMRAQLLEAANELRRAILGEELTGSTTTRDPDGARLLAQVEQLRRQRGLSGAERPFAERLREEGIVNLFVTAHPALAEQRRELLEKPWDDVLAKLEASAEEIIRVPDALDRELRQIVSDFRKDMPLLKKVRAALVASLNLVPPVLAIAYVFATYDPVGATTIAGKLSGLFGLNDLWATVSIPASSGLDQATRKDLARLLDPVLQHWFASRAKPVDALFARHISGDILAEAQDRLARANDLAEEIQAALDFFKSPAAGGVG